MMELTLMLKGKESIRFDAEDVHFFEYQDEHINISLHTKGDIEELEEFKYESSGFYKIPQSLIKWSGFSNKQW